MIGVRERYAYRSFKAILELFALVVIGLSAASVALIKGDDNDIANVFDFGNKGNARQMALIALYVSCITELLLLLCRFVFYVECILFRYTYRLRIQVTPNLINGICLSYERQYNDSSDILWGLWLAVGSRSASINHLVPSCGTTLTVCTLFRAYQTFAWVYFFLSFVLAMSTPAFYRKLWPEVYLDQPTFVDDRKENAPVAS
ncbi:hypothetical protein SCHPADRAFT_885095 [Schizopora paradoxa]|uniref:Uncharacterized protein n=1 Tax=Schizopora paradoxa TaxID=27342 RepID=A0A0H2S6C5_9AGAM|nr:hypothetical protein SCHPADRAFT_885095 [Schizopora paradoxa]